MPSEFLVHLVNQTVALPVSHVKSNVLTSATRLPRKETTILLPHVVRFSTWKLFSIVQTAFSLNIKLKISAIDLSDINHVKS